MFLPFASQESLQVAFSFLLCSSVGLDMCSSGAGESVNEAAPVEKLLNALGGLQIESIIGMKAYGFQLLTPSQSNFLKMKKKL